MASMKSFNDPKLLVKSFTLDSCPRGNQGFSRVLIQLFGFLGNGKTSFINTCKCVLDNKPLQISSNEKASYGAATTVRISHPLTNTITLVDNRGLLKNTEQERAVVFAQIANLLPLDTKVEWTGGYNGLIDRIVEGETVVKSSDFIYPVYVHSVKKGINPKELDEIEHLLKTTKQLTGMYPIVVLTHKRKGDLNAMKNVFEKMNIERIVALENLTPINNLKTKEISDEVWNFFQDIIEDINFCLERLRDPVTEKQERKKFVLNYIHEIDMKNVMGMTQEMNARPIMAPRPLIPKPQGGTKEPIYLDPDNVQKNVHDVQKNERNVQKNVHDVQKNERNVQKNVHNVQKNERDVQRNVHDVQNNERDVQKNVHDVQKKERDVQNVRPDKNPEKKCICC